MNEKEASQYRFSGYQLPKITLDDGFEYDYVPVHPYFYSQPEFWSGPVYTYKDGNHINGWNNPSNDESQLGNQIPVSEQQIQEFKQGHKKLFNLL